MVLFTNNLTLDLLGILTALIVVAIAFVKYRYTYYSRKGLYTPKPILFFGNAKKVFTREQTFGELWFETYKDLKRRNLKHGGVYFFTTPFYIPTDLNIIKSILQNDFQHFIGHGFYVNEDADPLSANLFNLSGDKWRNMRMKLTPTFTSGKMKMMFETLAKCTEGLKDLLDEAVDGKEAVDIKELLQRFTIDIIGSCAFGLECNSMKNPDTEFAKYGREIFESDFIQLMKAFLQVFIPHGILKKFNLSIQKESVTKFFMDLTKQTVEYREKNNIYRRDFMHLLLQLKNKGEVTDDTTVLSESGKSTSEGLTLKEIAAQVFVFFIAGFETSSATMTFALLELSKKTNLRKRLRKEIVEVLAKHDNKLTYDAIKDMKYMDQVLDETLRMHPPVPFLLRECNADYQIPGTDVIIEKGERVQISTLGIHRDPEIYPDPETFDPERFTEENKAKRHNFAWLPFGAGPRACIGLRFGVMQAKVGLATILKNFDFTLNEKTVQPIKYDPSNFILSVSKGVWINLRNNEDN